MRRYGKARSRIRRRFIKRRRRYTTKKTYLSRRKRRFFKKRVETKYKDQDSAPVLRECGRIRADAFGGWTSGALEMYNDGSSSGGGNSIFPIINEGTGRQERIGVRIRLQGFSMHMRIKQQLYTAGNGRIRVVIWQKKYDAAKNADPITSIFEPNELSFPSIIDADSFYNPEVKNKYKIIHDKKYRIKQDSVSQFLPLEPVAPETELAPINVQTVYRDVRIKKRFGSGIMVNINHPVYYQETAPSNDPIRSGDFGMWVLCDRGNVSTYDAPLSCLPDSKQMSGYEITFKTRWYWTDQ